MQSVTFITFYRVQENHNVKSVCYTGQLARMPNTDYNTDSHFSCETKNLWSEAIFPSNRSGRYSSSIIYINDISAVHVPSSFDCAETFRLTVKLYLL